MCINRNKNDSIFMGNSVLSLIFIHLLINNDECILTALLGVKNKT